MAQTNFTPILTYKSDTASAVPSAGNLTNSANGAELAVNTADKRLFTKDSGGNVVELGTNPSSLTLPNSTTNGVVYANGSKVLTTGSALTFDGTNIATTGGLSLGSANNLTWGGVYGANIPTIAGASNTLQFYPAGSTSGEQMRLTSTGLGIGTSSPTAKLDVRGNATFTGNGTSRQTADFTNTGGQLYVGAESSSGGAVFVGSSAYAGIVGTNTNTPLQLGTNGTIKATLDSSGNLGLGVTPSAWASSGNAQFQKLTFAGNDYSLGSNYYQTPGEYRYASTDTAAKLSFYNGQFLFYTAPSGTAGNAISFTQAMTLDASGRLLVGTTTAQGQLTISNLSGSIGLTAYTSGGSVAEHTYSNTPGVQIDSYQSVFGSPYTKTTDIVANADSGAASQLRLFTTSAGSAPAERARIDSSGNLIQTVNTTAATLATNNTLTFSIVDNSTLRISVRGSDGTTRTATVALT